MAKRSRNDDDTDIILKDPHNRLVIERKRKKVREKRKEETVEELEKKLNAFKPSDADSFTSFSQFPLSQRTLAGLDAANFVNPTDIQRQTLRYSIVGRDVIGAAKTGSGKTLALIIPLLDRLFRLNWTRQDGLGVLVICPTRELSYQIYNIINLVGARHDFSVALLIGGTNAEYEKKRLSTMNIVICTPGRLLQHLDENENFSCDQLQMLIIDEADRILDMGFQRQMDSIIENLPKERQTLLFSATQTKKVNDLSRVSLIDPVEVSVHENDEKATPDSLEQSYFVCEEHEKINMLWSFLKSHQRKKTLIFVTCCKEARYLTEAIRHLRPGLPLMGLWGNMCQTKRLETFENFDEHQHGAALIATDVASRGLDFRALDWVLQLDCPADVDDYIHRVGRTARIGNRGRATLVLTPSQEEPFVELLQKRKIPITKLDVNDRHMNDIRLKLANLMVPFPQLKEFAQRSFVAYARAIYFMKLKSVFDVKSINFEELASSYGLPLMPRIRFLQKQGLVKKRHDFAPQPEKSADDSNNAQEVLLADGDAIIPSKSGRKFGAKTVPSDNNHVEEDETHGDDPDDFMHVARRDVFNVLKGATVEDEIDARILHQKDRVMSKTELAKKILKRGICVNKRIKFNDSDEEVAVDGV